jgi:UDP:flavonoid glycosyltransferase YjiC (YdhE family)
MDPIGARAELGLNSERPAILIQLGARRDRDDRELLEIGHRHLRQRFDVQIATSGRPSADLPSDVVRLQVYPLCRYFRAFDGAISAADDTSCHELIHHGLPTIFVPDERASTDDQVGRARYAERRGLGLCVRSTEPYRVRGAIDRLMDPDQGRAIAERGRALVAGNGAKAAAELVQEMVLSLPASAPPGWAGRI